MAAKLNQHMNPCFEMMIDKLPSMLRKQVSREQLVRLEMKILQTLDFDLQWHSPLSFLERYQRVLQLDMEKTNTLNLKIGYSARKLLRHMMHKSQFLAYRPSQIAATAILVAIDLNKQEVEKEMKKLSLSPQKRSGLVSSQSRIQHTEKKRANHSILEADKPLPEEDRGNFDDMLSCGDSSDLRRQGDESECQENAFARKKQTSFQKVWSREVTQITKVSKSKDILPVLRDLVSSLE